MPTFPRGHHAHLQRLHNAQHIAQLQPPEPITHRHAGYQAPDPVDLRGIPAIGRTVGGTIPGTQPEQHTCR